MRKRIITVLCVSFVLLLSLLNPVSLHTETAAPSPGYTLAAGESTCGAANCHVGNDEVLDNSRIVLSSVLSPSISSGYQPGQTYNLNVGMGTVQQMKKGFQITATDQNGNGAGVFSLSPNATTTTLDSFGNKQYVGHKNANTISSWVFKWQAPATDIGPVTFFYTGVGANDDGLSTGDVVYRGRAVATTSGFSQLNLTGIKPISADEVQSLKIFPNPFSDRLSIEYFLHDESRVTIKLFDMSGKLVKQLDECIEVPGFHQRNFTFEEKLTAGIYLLRLTEGEKIYFKKLITG